MRNTVLPIKLVKGALIAVDGWYYVLVYPYASKDGSLSLFCICDNANNIYSWKVEHIDEFPPADREIPYDVIAEVLLGEHDDRFEHWTTQ